MRCPCPNFHTGNTRYMHPYVCMDMGACARSLVEHGGRESTNQQADRQVARMWMCGKRDAKMASRVRSENGQSVRGTR